MEDLYTERNDLREGIEKTSDISSDVARLIINCCDKYLDNLSNKYPKYCYDSPDIVCGLNRETLNSFLKIRIPNLPITDNGVNLMDNGTIDDTLKYALFDYIEYISREMKTMKKGKYHEYFVHYHLNFVDSNDDFDRFSLEINDVFKISGVLYTLTSNKRIERITEGNIIIEKSSDYIKNVPEKGLKELVAEAIYLYKDPKSENHHLATEKIWDALERLKTIYSTSEKDKKSSADKVVNTMSKNDSNYMALFNEEFKKLTDIGNSYRIRHHETTKIEIPEDAYYDYFFCRCLSLIVLAIKFNR
ncbi:MAG: hypothetical protein WCR36_11180 [Bacteroidaceae bacterium]